MPSRPAGLRSGLASLVEVCLDVRMQTRHTSTSEERLTIGDAAALAGVSVDTLRRWADKLQVPSERRPSGHRVFRRADIEAIHQPTVADADTDAPQAPPEQPAAQAS